MLSSPKGAFYSMMVARLGLKIPFRYHYCLWVQCIQISISRVVHNTHTHASMTWSIVSHGLTPIQILNSLSFCSETRAEWVRHHYFWLVDYPGFFSLNFYNWSCCLWLNFCSACLPCRKRLILCGSIIVFCILAPQPTRASRSPMTISLSDGRAAGMSLSRSLQKPPPRKVWQPGCLHGRK